MSEEIIHIDPNSVKISDNRYRFEGLGDIEALTNSIRDHGQKVPIIITQDNILIAGERRLTACRELGISVRAVYEEEGDDNNRKIVEIIENIDREDFTWREKARAVKDLHELMVELKGKKWSGNKTAEEVGISKGGFSDDMNLAKALESEPDLFNGCPTRSSALKALKNHKLRALESEIAKRRTGTDYGKKATQFLIHGDCLEVLQEVESSSIDLLITDPPYGINLEKSKHSSDRGDIKYDTPENFDLVVRGMIQELPRIMKPNSWVCMFCGVTQASEIMSLLKDVDVTCDFMLGIWNKEKLGQTNHPEIYFSRSYEVFIYGYIGSAVLTRTGVSNIISIEPVPTHDKIHDVEKPVSLFKELISRFCLPGYTVLDPFAGSASSVIAALELGCIPVGIEKEESYYNKAIARLINTIMIKGY